MPPLAPPYHDRSFQMLEDHTMLKTALLVLLFAAALGSGVMAGIFFAFSNSVMTALTKIPAAQGVAAMQAINLAVVNPLFMLAFLGTAIASVVLIVAALLGWGDLETGWVIAGSVLYLGCGIGVTAAYNIPRNNALAHLASDAPASTAYWTRYVPEWTAGNHVRTAGSVAALACFLLALR